MTLPRSDMTGEQALAAFTQAAKLVKAGDFEAARKIDLLPSDRAVIEERIAKCGLSAKGANTKEVE